MTLSQIANATGGVLCKNINPLIKVVSTDSREVVAGDLFIAINGKYKNGADYVSEARKKGGYILSPVQHLSDIFHTDSRAALLSFAKFYKNTLPYILYRIGITGSVGKTTTKEFLRVILQSRYKTHANEGNFNNEIGLPMSVLSAGRECEILIMEMGMNHRGEIAKMSDCLAPNLALITNIGTAHIGNLGSREEIAKAKLEILHGMTESDVIVPHDEPLLSAAGKSTFSLNNTSADFSLITDRRGYGTLYKSGKPYLRGFRPPHKEEHHLQCLIAAASVAMRVGLTPEEISLGISSISDDNIRQRCFFYENYVFYADYYNASRESVLALINAGEKIDHSDGKSLLIGDILELGNMGETIHYEIGRTVSPSVFNNLFLFGELVHEVRRGAVDSGFPAERIFIINDTSRPELCADLIRERCKLGEMIFMKASRGMRLERVLDCFKN